jgi:hypothetical protein
MKKIMPTAAAAALLVAMLVTNPAGATPLGSAANTRLANETATVTQVWWGHHRFHRFRFHHRFCRWCW